MINIIYGLRDPRNDVYQYIGKSTIGIERPLKHLTQSHSLKVNEWVAFLEEKMLYPIVDIIEEVEDIDKLTEREKYWIGYYYDINPNLLNIQSIDYRFQNIRNDKDEEDFYYLSSIIQNIPQMLKKERMCRQLTQDALSEMAGMSRSTLSLCERGGGVTLKSVQDYIRALKGIDIISKTYGDRAVSTTRRKYKKKE